MLGTKEGTRVQQPVEIDNPLHQLSTRNCPRPQQTVALSRKEAEALYGAFHEISPLRSASFEYGGQRYCSRSEAACAVLMQRYVKGFRLEEANTYQVPLARSIDGTLQCADFMVRDVLLEYHPPRFWQNGNRSGDFDSIQDYIAYVRARKSMERAERQAFKEETLQDLVDQYTGSRQALINMNPYLVGTELVVAVSPEDFYRKIICRFCKTPPPLNSFLYEFKKVRAGVTELKQRKAA